ncbi:complex I subunit 4 family protein [Buchnera aphidicola]|uniref:complex I subunit 4 family protein n=1 Tax=Buchnera aphidicola TaxID=9 RepID=UPI0031B89224
MLPLLIFIPFFGGIISFLLQKISNKLPKFIAMFSILLIFLLNIFMFVHITFPKLDLFCINFFSNKFCFTWMEDIGIHFSLYEDIFSSYMIFLTTLLGLLSIIFSYYEIYKNPGTFYLNVLILISSTIGSFLSTNLIFFFCFLEIIIFTICFLNIFWGSKDIDTSIKFSCIKKFFLQSQISSLVMLFSILLLFNYYHSIYGVWTFDFNLLKHAFINKSVIENIILFGFLLSFIIKIPSIPFHTWLPDVMLFSPRGNFVDLIGFLSKVGIYGLLRFFIPISGNIFYKIQYFMILLGIINVFYGTFMASIKNNLKHALAYINISHVGIILLSMFNFNNLSYEGLFLYIISSTISSSLLFILSSKLYNNFNTYNFKSFGGLWKIFNTIPGFFLFFVLSNFGLPGTGNFISEILIFIGFFLSHQKISIFFTFSLMLFAFCYIKLFHRIFYGSLKNNLKCCDLSFVETLFVSLLILFLIFIGLFPNFIFNNFNFFDICFN